VRLDRLITTFVMLVADRMARKPLTVDENWNAMATEFNLASSLRIVLKHGGTLAAAKGLFHMAWLLFAHRFINIPFRPLNEPLESSSPMPTIDTVVRSIQSLNVHGVGDEVQAYLDAGRSGDDLLRAIGRETLWDDTNMRLIPTLRAVFTEWENSSGDDVAAGAGHPARSRLQVGLARYAADVRLNKNSQSAINTAMRFAEGRTTVEVFD
jgi:hypothetical protein